MKTIFYLLLLVLVAACGERAVKQASGTTTEAAINRADIPKLVNGVRFTTENTELRYGDKLNGELVVGNRLETDSIVCYWDGKRVATTQSGPFTLTVPEGRTGKNVIKFIAYHPDNKQSIVTQGVTVKPKDAPHAFRYEVVKTYPHDPKAYTQGLIYHDGFMYEGTGQHGASSVRKVDITKNDILSVLSLDNQYFGEGITIYKNKIYQITWQSQVGFVYDLKTFSLESTFNYYSQGWGITTVDNKLIMSDGTNKLYHVAPESFGIIKEVEVYDNIGEVVQLNELEYINGLVWANVWLSDRIVMIDPDTGAVKGELDMSKLLTPGERAKLDMEDEVLNGIAYRADKGTVFLTGKRWPKLFEIKILP